MQVNGYNQNAHYALVRALAVYGTPYIDRTRGQIGDVSTGDVATYKGHVYAAKAPGLAFLSVPASARGVEIPPVGESVAIGCKGSRAASNRAIASCWPASVDLRYVLVWLMFACPSHAWIVWSGTPPSSHEDAASRLRS